MMDESMANQFALLRDKSRVLTEMLEENTSAVGFFGQHSAVEHAIRELQNAAFDIKKLSIIGRDYQSEDNVTGFYSAGDRMKYWGKLGAFWGRMWGLLDGAAVLFIPGVGPIVVAGSVVSWIAAALEGALVVGGLSALGAGLYSLGVPKDSILKYETSMKPGKFILIAHGTTEEVRKARGILQAAGAEQVNVHSPVEDATQAA
jgi:hypothetical protein